MAKNVVANCLRGGADATSWFTSILDAQSCKKWLAAKPLPWYKKALKAILREAEGEKKAALQRDCVWQSHCTKNRGQKPLLKV